jgi:hypothetical protein
VPFVGFKARAYFFPNDVSFSNVEIQEGLISSSQEGYWDKKFPNGYDHPEGGWFGIMHNPTGPLYNSDSVDDNVHSGLSPKPPAYEDGSYFQWEIPWFYRVLGSAKRNDKYFIMIHRITMDKNGNMTITKGGVTQSTPPY